MTCPSYWSRLVRENITTRFPKVLVIQARSYGASKTFTGLGGIEHQIDPVEPSEGDPIRSMVKFLKKHYDPSAADEDQVLYYHPRGGFRYYRQSG